MNDESVLMIAVAGVLIAAIVSLTLVMLRRHQVLREGLAQREQVLARLSERFGDSEDFVAFATSPDAERLFPTLDGPTSIARRLLALTAAAVVISAVGVAFLINSLAPLPSPDINFVREAQEARWWAVLFLALGIGRGLAVALCARMARRWGLLTG